MSKLRVFESISVDGYFCHEDGDMSWAHNAGDAEFADWVSGNASSGGELLFGRVTYQMMAAFWPTPLAAAQMPLVARGMNAAKKYVVSKTLQPTWNNTQLISGDMLAEVAALKQRSGSGITVLGSGSLVAQLAEAQLVDEYQFVIVPLALGSGRKLFTKICNLRLVQQRAFACGNLVVTYAAAS